MHVGAIRSSCIFVGLALTACAHAGAGPAVSTVAGSAPPDSLVVAFTDAGDSVAERLIVAGRYHVAAAGGTDTRLLATAPGEARVLVMKPVAPRDARDALDEGVDALVTSDPAAVAYAATRPDLVSAPLAWDRAYLLVSPNGPVPNATPADSALRWLRVELATDAVRVEARPAEDPCRAAGPAATGASPPAPMPERSPRILYDGDDPVAGSLAARLVALAASHPGRLRGVAPDLAAAGAALGAAGVARARLVQEIAARRALAFVIAVPARAAGACDALESGRGDITVIPLVETRARVIARRGVAEPLFTWLGAASTPPDTVR